MRVPSPPVLRQVGQGLVHGTITAWVWKVCVERLMRPCDCGKDARRPNSNFLWQPHTSLLFSTSQCLSTPELLVLKSIPKDLHVSRQNLHAQWALRRGPSLILLLLEGLNVGTIGTRFHSSPVHGICLLVSREETTVTTESSSKTGPLPQPLFQASAHSLLVSVLPV